MDNLSERRRRAIIAVAVITAFITTFTGSALNLSVPDIGQQFGVSAGSVGWLITGYTLAVAAFSVPMGRLADITCRKTILVTGIVIFTACCGAAVFSVSMPMLLTVRIVQGIGAAMIFSTNTAMLISSFPQEERGKMLGFSLASTYVGLSAGPVVGGLLNHNLGWQSIFVLTGTLGAVALIVGIAGLPGDRPDSRGQSVDMPGSLMYIAFIAILMYGLSEIGEGILPVALAAAGIVLGVIFTVREAGTEDPIVNVRLFAKNRGYAFSNLSALMNYGATFAISYLISIYLQVVMGYSSQAAGLIMIFQPAVMAALSPVTGRLSDRISPFKLSSGGMAFCAAGTCMFCFIDEDSSLVLIIAALLVTGLGFALFSSPNTNAVMSCVDKSEYGVASSILATMRSIGHTLSMVIVTVTVTALIGEMSLAEAPPEDLCRVIRISFITFTAMCAAGIFLSLKRGKPGDLAK